MRQMGAQRQRRQQPLLSQRWSTTTATTTTLKVWSFLLLMVSVLYLAQESEGVLPSAPPFPDNSQLVSRLLVFDHSNLTSAGFLLFDTTSSPSDPIPREQTTPIARLECTTPGSWMYLHDPTFLQLNRQRILVGSYFCGLWLLDAASGRVMLDILQGFSLKDGWSYYNSDGSVRNAPQASSLYSAVAGISPDYFAISFGTHNNRSGAVFVFNAYTGLSVRRYEGAVNSLNALGLQGFATNLGSSNNFAFTSANGSVILVSGTSLDVIRVIPSLGPSHTSFPGFWAHPNGNFVVASATGIYLFDGNTGTQLNRYNVQSAIVTPNPFLSTTYVGVFAAFSNDRYAVLVSQRIRYEDNTTRLDGLLHFFNPNGALRSVFNGTDGLCNYAPTFVLTGDTLVSADGLEAKLFNSNGENIANYPLKACVHTVFRPQLVWDSLQSSVDGDMFHFPEDCWTTNFYNAKGGLVFKRSKSQTTEISGRGNQVCRYVPLENDRFLELCPTVQNETGQATLLDATGRVIRSISGSAPGDQYGDGVSTRYPSINSLRVPQLYGTFDPLPYAYYTMKTKLVEVHSSVDGKTLVTIQYPFISGGVGQVPLKLFGYNAIMPPTTSPSITPSVSRSKENTPTPRPTPKDSSEPPKPTTTALFPPGDGDDEPPKDLEICPEGWFGCKGKCVRSVSDCQSSNGGGGSNDPITVDVPINSDKTQHVPVLGRDGKNLGKVEIPRDTFPKGTVVRISRWKGPGVKNTGVESDSDEDDCGDDEKENKEAKQVSAAISLEAYSPEPLKRSSSGRVELKKPITLSFIVDMKDEDIGESELKKRLCLGFNEARNSKSASKKWKCPKAASQEIKKLSNNRYRITARFDHLTGFSTLLGSSSLDGGTVCMGAIFWLTIAFLIAAFVLVTIVVLTYYVYHKRKSAQRIAQLKATASSSHRLEPVQTFHTPESSA